MIEQVKSEILDLDQDVVVLIRDNIDKAVLNLKKYNFNNVKHGLIAVKSFYFILKFFILDLKKDKKNLNLILKNFSSSLEFIEYMVSSIIPKLKLIEDYSNISDDVKNIVKNYYNEIKSLNYKKLEFKFEISSKEKPLIDLTAFDEVLNDVSKCFRTQEFF